MASNVSQNIVPSFWSSANDDVLFEFSFNPYIIDSINNASGKVEINLQLDFDVTPVIGEYIYINSNVYVGTYKILSVTSTSQVTIDLTYVSGITSYTYFCYHLRVPTFSFYKGFNTAIYNNSFANNLPYTKVIDIKPSVLYNSATGIPYLSINLKGSVKYIFNILPNTVANSVDFSMFNAIRLIWDGYNTIFSSYFDYNLVLNSSITNDELIETYVGGGVYFLPIDKPLISTQGVSFATIMGDPFVTGEFPVLHKFINGVKQ
jgi:hypothetical protein